MMPDYPKPPFASQKQPMPGTTDAMQPRPDHGDADLQRMRPPEGSEGQRQAVHLRLIADLKHPTQLENDSFSVMAGLRARLSTRFRRKFCHD